MYDWWYAAGFGTGGSNGLNKLTYQCFTCLMISLSCYFASSDLFRQSFWMKLHGHLCLKRTALWSVSPAIRLLDLGPIQKAVHKSLVSTATKYQDSKGKTRYKGSGDLKATQSLGYFECTCWTESHVLFPQLFFPKVCSIMFPRPLARLYPCKFVSKVFEHRKLFKETAPRLPQARSLKLNRCVAI